MVIFLSKTPFIDVGEEPHLDSQDVHHKPIR